jgi:type II secretory pathway component PulF
MDSTRTAPLPLLAVLDVGGSVAVLAIYFFVIPQFIALFQNFGAHLPTLTMLFILRPGPYWTFIFVNVVVSQVALIMVAQRRSLVAQNVLVGTLCIDGLTMVLAIVAMYWPIFELGRAI